MLLWADPSDLEVAMAARLAIILSMLLSLLTATPASAAKRVALVVGNSAYAHAGTLRNPANDAKAVADALEKLGFDVLVGYDLTGRDFSFKVVDFAEQLKSADVALFYYAGHAIQYEERNYLIPVDAELANEFSVKREAIDAIDIVNEMERKAKASLVFLDSCRNNPWADGLRKVLTSSNRSAAIGRGLARIPSSGADTLLVYSAEPGNVAEDGTGDNSPFTTAFLKHVTTPGIDVEVMMKRVTADVREVTSDRQRPERLSKLTIEFYFNEGQTVVTTETEDGTTTTSASGTPGEAAEAWNAIKETEDTSDLEDFIAQFPDTFFTKLARKRLAKLTGVTGDVNPVAAGSIVGTYYVTGVNTSGAAYRGKAEITKEGDLFKVAWDINNGDIYSGTGPLEGDTLTIDWGSETPAIYKVGADGALKGTWAEGKASEDLTPVR